MPKATKKQKEKVADFSVSMLEFGLRPDVRI
jgi:hypothetical protein